MGNKGRSSMNNWSTTTSTPMLDNFKRVLCFWCLCWSLVEASVEQTDAETSPSLYDVLNVSKRPSLPSKSKQCPIYRNEALYSIVDRICELCFEMFRHQDPNLRAKCRSRCFQNTQFTTCVAIFNPSLELGVVPMRRRENEE